MKDPRGGSVRQRIGDFDWRAIATELDATGYARLPGLLTADECASLRHLHADRTRFRSFVDLAAHRYGDRGDYRYFARPLPTLVQSLRTHLYARLAPIANAWQKTLGRESRFPRGLGPFVARCHANGQQRPTPLLLRYDPGGYNCLHQDVYGEVAFPLQVAVLLSDPHDEFSGGAFLLTEQRPRMQSRGEAIALERGEGLIFPNRERPVAGRRGHSAARVRHGVSRVQSGERFTLGIIFHDAR